MITLKMLVTSGIQPPHPVPAFVFVLTASSVFAPFLTQFTMSSFVTFWEERQHRPIPAQRSTYVAAADLGISV
jgi:hypothetical protein